MAEHQAQSQAMQAAKDESERQAIWQQYTQRLTESYERERQELAEHFGGRVRHLINEYRSRRMLSDSDAHHIEWECQSEYWIADAATSLDALARKL
jgi:hypothetical protein